MTTPEQKPRATSPHFSSPLTPRVCEMLVALEKRRNMGEAASELGVLQSVLSRQLAGVEKGLDVTLFARTTRSMEPTAEGLVIVREATRILASLDKANAELAVIARGGSGLIQLGVASVAAAVFAPQAIAAFQKKQPGVCFSVRDDTPVRLLDDLMMGHLDAVILRPLADARFQVEKVKLYDEPIRFVVRGNHPLANAPKLSWDRLMRFQWILPTHEYSARTQMDRFFASKGLTPEAGILQTLSVPLIIGLVAVTDSITLMADSLAQRCMKTEGFRILPVICPLEIEPVSLVWRKEGEMTPAMAGFMATALATAKEINTATADKPPVAMNVT